MSNFSLIILEYTSAEEVISSEQKWIDLLKPDYNVNPVAGSSKGYKHSKESIEKIRNAVSGRKHSEEVKQAMSDSRKGENNSFYGKKHSKETKSIMKAIAANRKKTPVPGIEVEITDLETKINYYI